MSLRIAWFSNSPLSSPSGYSMETMRILPRLKALGHEVCILSTHGAASGSNVVDGIPIYPAGAEHGAHSSDVIGPWSRHFKADLTVTFYDVWPLDPARFLAEGARRWVPYYPVDNEPIPDRVAEPIKAHGWDSIAYSRFGQEEAAKVGLVSHFIPHSYDPAVLYPVADRFASLKLVGLPNDGTYIVGVVAANNDPHPSRKAWHSIIAGFAEFRKRVAPQKVLLYLHTQQAGQVDIATLVTKYALNDVTRICDQGGYILGFSRDFMRHTYNAFDVLLSPSMGEGFDLPVLEAQACGVPVVTSGWTATEELLFGGVHLRRDEATPIWTAYNANQWMASPEKIAEALMVTYRHWEHGQPFVPFRPALDAYQIDNVVETGWKPLLGAFEVRIRAEERPAEIPAGPKWRIAELGPRRWKPKYAWPDVTICTMATRNHEAAWHALRRCRMEIEYGGQLIFSDREQGWGRENVHIIPPFAGEPAISEWALTEAAAMVGALPTSHILSVHWDGFIVRPEAWDPTWLEYDYIGAPWPDGVVGNNGFSLTSTRFWLAVASLGLKAGECWPGDVVLCRGKVRAHLEALGMRYAPADVARRFSVENEEWDGSFGFHGVKALASVVRQGGYDSSLEAVK